MKASCIVIFGLAATIAATAFFTQTAPPAQAAESTASLVIEEALTPMTQCALQRFRNWDIDHAAEGGLFETGLRPVFPENTNCREIDAGYVVDYPSKRIRKYFQIIQTPILIKKG
jgi:hypothetical protein